MITKCFKTGNSVANYRVRQGYCEVCHGEGVIKKDHEELREFVDSTSYTLSEYKEIVRRWKSTGEILCDYCNGTGVDEKWGV